LSPSTERLFRLLAQTQAPEHDWRKAYRLAFAMLRQEMDLHPNGRAPSDVFEAAAATTRAVAAGCLPLGMALTMHLYPLCALRCVPLPWWSPANYRRHRLLHTIDRHGLILANAGSERVQGRQAPVSLTRLDGGVQVDGAFDYVSLANVADLLLFSAPTIDGQHLFCITDLRAESARIGAPRFAGNMKLSDTCSLAFERHRVSAGSFVMIPGDAALDCMTQYQRSWFQLLASEAHLARLDHLRQRWQMPRRPEDLAGLNELALLRDYALRLLDDAGRPAAMRSLAHVTAALKLRVSWQCRAMADALHDIDASAASELCFLQRQPTADERILRSLASPDQPLVVDQRHLALAGGAHAAKAAT
jgi:alkylation response protein AidB-like acyl-CoA dehydrogenase